MLCSIKLVILQILIPPLSWIIYQLLSSNPYDTVLPVAYRSDIMQHQREFQIRVLGYYNGVDEKEENQNEILQK